MGPAVGAAEQQGCDSAFDTRLGKKQRFIKVRRHFYITISSYIVLSKSLTHGPTIKEPKQSPTKPHKDRERESE